MAKNKMSVFILLDRSGSMNSGSKWETSIGSINEYVKTLKEEGVSAQITVATFDSVLGAHVINGINGLGYSNRSIPQFDIIRSKVSISNFKDIDYKEISPRGGTPLYDSAARIISLAEYENSKKTVILFVTDGEENESISETSYSARSKVERCQSRGWEVIFLGANFNADTQARSFGISANKVINSSLRNMDNTMKFYAGATASYASNKGEIDTMAVRDTMAK